MFEDLLNGIIQLLPNSNFTVPFELVTVYNSVNDIWDALPLVVRLAFIASFALMTLFCILRMLL